MKIAIVTDKPRVDFLPNEEGKQEDTQSYRTMKFIKDALSNEYEVIHFNMDFDIIEKLKDEKVDLVFNLCNGINGEASISQLPSMLELAGIPYTGSTPLAHGLAYNKIASGKMFKASNLATPDFIYINSVDEVDDIKLKYPVLVKPKDEGSSRGIHNDNLIFNKEDLRVKIEECMGLYNPPIMVMEYIEGKEFTVGILCQGDNPEVLGIAEIDFSGLPEGINKIFSFEAKFKYYDYVKYYIPPRIDEETSNKIKEAAKKAFKSLGLRDYSRVDIRLKDGIPYIIEINSLPGLDKETSDLYKLAASIGIEYDDLIKRIVKQAKKRI